RDVVSAEVIKNRGLIAVGHTVIKNAYGDVLTGFKQSNLFELVKCP
ncbi:MAG: transposase, partial [Geminocystis sp. GBBB08]|nr:transposase [Geminocystis sp. GBBB08]